MILPLCLAYGRDLMTICSLQGLRDAGLKGNTGTVQREGENGGPVCEEAGPSELGVCTWEQVGARLASQDGSLALMYSVARPSLNFPGYRGLMLPRIILP